MKREEMLKTVQTELKHIPRRIRGSTQNYLRVYYNAIRRHDLSINPQTPAKESLKKALEVLKKKHPDYAFGYDKEFF